MLRPYWLKWRSDAFAGLIRAVIKQRQLADGKRNKWIWRTQKSNKDGL